MAAININGKAIPVADIHTIGHYQSAPWEETLTAYYAWERGWGECEQLPAPNCWVDSYFVRYGAYEASVSYEQACAAIRAVMA